MKERQQLIVVGNGMVGHKFLERLVAQGGAETFQITVFGEEPRPAYDRVNLSMHFNLKEAESLSLASLDWYESNQIQLRLKQRIVTINREAQTVTTDQGESLRYDALVLATGSAAAVPPISGLEGEGVFVYRTFEDLEGIAAFAENARSVAVLGGGLLGLEAVKAMVDLKLETHLVELSDHLMPYQLDAQGGDFLKSRIEWLDVRVHLSRSTREIKRKERKFHFEFTTPGALAVDMIVVSIGIKPRDELAAAAGLQIGFNGGIAVDPKLTTSDPNIFAIGECASFNGRTYGLVAPGYRMAETLADNFMGGSRQFFGADTSTNLKLLGVEVASFGNAPSGDPFGREIILENRGSLTYKRLFFSGDGRRLTGGILVGDASDYNNLLQMYLLEMPVPDPPELLLVHPKDGSTQGPFSVAGLPDHAVVCGCENRSKGALVAAIQEQELETLDQLMQSTRCGISCGGCVPMLEQILQHELEAQQQSLDNTLCPHFAFTRKELQKKVSAANLTTYEQVLAEFGSGDGCDHCREIVAKMLLKLQAPSKKKNKSTDPIERFLSGIQKMGAYSVIPRVPAGDLTGEQLIALGAIAEAFKLVPKINLAQHIDLFGAQREDLPKIWEKLIAAGFESGHTVNSSLGSLQTCLGQKWCGHALNDSSELTRLFELRYKGLSLPSKIKGAVSGCPNDCAGIYSKDFGVVATEQGWNLLIGGAGGSQPTTAKLLGKNLSVEDLTQVMDRLMAYYGRTTTKRISFRDWFVNESGGIRQLQQTLIQDTQGIVDELDQEIAEKLKGSQCDWKQILESPGVHSYFRSADASREETAETHLME